MTDEIVIEYNDPESRAWTGNSVKRATLNGVPIYRLLDFNFHFRPDSLAVVRLEILLGQLSINPVERKLTARLAAPKWGRVEARARAYLERLKEGDELHGDDFDDLYADVMDAVHGEEWHKY